MSEMSIGKRAAPSPPARAACEAFWVVIRGRDGLRNDPVDAWPWAASQGADEAWEAAAKAGSAALRDGVAALADRLDASAKGTRPSRKSDIEAEVATGLRRLLEGP